MGGGLGERVEGTGFGREARGGELRGVEMCGVGDAAGATEDGRFGERETVEGLRWTGMRPQ